MEKLRLGQAKQLLEKLLPALGNADKVRLEQLLPWLNDQADDHALNMAAVIERLYPTAADNPKKAERNFGNLRSRLNSQADEADISIRFEADSQKRSNTQQRQVFFSGQAMLAVDAQAITQANVGSGMGDPSQQEGELEKPTIRFFISYAHADEAEMKNLLNRLQPHLSINPDYRFIGWDDRNLLAGENWFNQLMLQMEDSDLGLLLLSVPFLASGFCMNTELREFLDGNGTVKKPLVLTALKALPLTQPKKMQGLDARQIFHHKRSKAFHNCASGRDKDAYVAALCDHIEQQVERYYAHRKPDTQPKDNQSTQKRLFPPKSLTPTAQQLMIGTSDELITEAWGEIGHHSMDGTQPDAKRKHVQTTLRDWVLHDSQTPYFSLFGELGMGKTMNSQCLAKETAKLHDQQATTLLPFYFDLRNLRLERGEAIPDIEAILNRLIKNSWKAGDKPATSANEVLKALRDGQALLIFDGIDEVIVAQSPQAGKQFIRELWSALPPLLVNEAIKANKATGKLLLTCRSHYFRDLHEQRNTFLGEQRDGLKEQHYQSMTLLPFTKEQVQQYLRLHLNEAEAKKLEQLIEEVHDLKGLSSRPYLLNLIRETAPALEAEKQQHGLVNTASIYRNIAQQWLHRDDGKHQWNPLHKQELMEALAAALWRSGERQWSVGKLEKWLDHFLHQHPEIAHAQGGINREILKEDLRTATFIVRPGTDKFRFAHTSFQEYFLACWLVNGLLPSFDDRCDTERWAIEPAPSKETLDFVADLLEQASNQATLQQMGFLLGTAKAQRSHNLMAYWLRAHERSRPCPEPAHIDLNGLDFSDWQFVGSKAQPLNLSGADFSHSQLFKASFQHCQLTGANLQHSQAECSEWLACELNGAQFQAAQLTGATFRHCHLPYADFTAAVTHQTEWQGCLAPVIADNNISRACPSPHPKTKVPSTFAGHSRPAMSICFDHQSQRIASAGYDNSVTIWGTNSAKPIHTLKGHNGTVSSICFDHNSQRIASASHDGSIIIWDTNSAKPIHTLKGHSDWATSVCFDHQSQLIASASFDGSVIIWDSTSAQPIQTFKGHSRGITSLCFNHNSQRIASASYDGSIIIWDTDSARPARTLKNHTRRVTSLCFDHNSQRIASASFDGSVIIWEVNSATPMHTLNRHKGGVTSLCFDHNSQRIASASHDGSIIIWDANSAKPVHTLNGHNGPVNSICFNHNSQRIASANYNHSITIWDTNTTKPTHTLKGHSNWVNSVCFDHQSQRIVSANHNGSVIIWDANSAKPIHILKGHNGSVNSVCFDHQSRRIASASNDGSVIIWDANSAKPIHTLNGHSLGVTSLCFDHNSRHIASASNDGSVIIWDANSAQLIHTFKGHDSLITSVCFNHNSQRIAFASDDGCIIIGDANSAKPIYTLKNQTGWATSLCFDHNSQRIASANYDGSVIIWNASSATPIRTLKGHHGPVNSVCFNHNSERIASASHDGRVIIWDPTSAKPIQTLKGHSGPVTSVCFNHNSKLITSTGTDGTTIIWDTSSGKPLKQLWKGLHDDWASFDDQQFLGMSDNAWRYMGWQADVPDPKRPGQTQRIRLPAEHFEPICEASKQWQQERENKGGESWDSWFDTDAISAGVISNRNQTDDPEE